MDKEKVSNAIGFVLGVIYGVARHKAFRHKYSTRSSKRTHNFIIGSSKKS